MTSPGDVETLSTAFASDLTNTFDSVLPEGTPTQLLVRAAARRQGETRVSISPMEKRGIPLTVDGHELLRFVCTYQCKLAAGDDFLAVNASAFKVLVKNANAPLFTLDYVREAGSLIPAAHYNIHAERLDMDAAMASVGSRNRGRTRQTRIAQGQAPRYADLHFPVGGHRFRPCIEDVLAMLILEFAIDVQPHALEVLAEKRANWRKVQLRAAVSDDPATAIAELERLNLVRATDASVPTANHDRMRAL